MSAVAGAVGQKVAERTGEGVKGGRRFRGERDNDLFGLSTAFASQLRRSLEARASSRTRCAFVPPNPNELTPAIAGRPLSGPGLELALDSEREGIEGNVGVRLGEVQARGNRPVVKRQGRLDQPGDSGRGLEVADVRLDRTECTFPSGVTSLGEHGAQRIQLDGIAEQGSRAMGFDVIDLTGRDAGLPVGRAEHGFLGRSAGGGQAVGAAVLVDRTAPDHGVDRVAVGQGARKRLEHHHPRALAANVAIGLRVERLASAVRRRGTRLLAKLANTSGRRIRFTPPASASSDSPSHRLRQARWTATSEDEQAVSIARLGPRKSKWCEIRLAAMLAADPVMR